MKLCHIRQSKYYFDYSPLYRNDDHNLYNKNFINCFDDDSCISGSVKGCKSYDELKEFLKWAHYTNSLIQHSNWRKSEKKSTDLFGFCWSHPWSFRFLILLAYVFSLCFMTVVMDMTSLIYITHWPFFPVACSVYSCY